MPSSSPQTSRSFQFGLLLLVALPCLPGFVFLLAGALRDPYRHLLGLVPISQSQFNHAWEQTRELYLAGGAVLLVGTLCSGFVVWKIARPSPPLENEELETESGNEPV